MIKADKLFELLGYEKEQITDEFIKYSKKKTKYNNSTKEHEISINFNGYDKYIGIKNKQFFSLKELQAIQMKCKELGWI